MRKIALFVLSSGLLACGVEDPATAERAQGQATTIGITFDIRPGVVVYRDGASGPWQYATRTSAVSYQAIVHGLYIVAYGCGDEGANVVAQIAQVPADGAQLLGYCDTVVWSGDDFRQVTGRMAQPGHVAFGFNDLETSTPNEAFSTEDVDGTYDLLSMTADHLALRRGVVIHGDTVIAPVIDTAAQGAPLRHASFSASNALPSETIAAVALLQTAGDGYFILHSGSPLDVPLGADAVLVASDEQSVSVRAKSGETTRAQRIPARAGSSTTAVLPDPLVGPTWTETSSTLAFDWTSRPAGFNLYAEVYGTSPNGTDFSTFNVQASDAYLMATGATHIDIKPNMPGIKPAWNIDLAAGYGHDASFQLTTPDGVTNSAWMTGYVDPDAAAGVAPMRVRAPRSRRAAR